MRSVIQPSAPDPLIGALLDGRYHVTGVLGRGAMAIVYEGLQQPLGRAVAIKVLGPDTASDSVVVARFLREARVASGLAHGNIVDVSDLGRLPDGRPYLVMPKVAGIDFATLLEREGPMPPARVANLLRGVAAALDLVHAKGLVHRDVKPENLMHVVRADGSETVMLLDFGIAALLAGNAARLTADDMMCGSPAYMAPELIATGKFDRRADVYALATVAFEMLAGCLPFDDQLPMRVMMGKTANVAPTLASVAETSFPDEIERVIARGLAREPAARYPSAGEFVTALDRAACAQASADEVAHEVQDHVAAFDSTRPAESVVPRARSSRAASAWGAATLAVLVVLFASWVAPRAAIHSTAARQAAKDDSASISELPAVAAVAVAAVVESPSVPVPQALPPPGAPRMRRHAVAARAIAPADSAQPSVVDAEELSRAANQELLQGHLARAIELFEQAIECNAQDVVALRGLGLANERLGRSADAIRAYQTVLAVEPNAALASKLRERLERLGAL